MQCFIKATYVSGESYMPHGRKQQKINPALHYGFYKVYIKFLGPSKQAYSKESSYGSHNISGFTGDLWS